MYGATNPSIESALAGIFHAQSHPMYLLLITAMPGNDLRVAWPRAAIRALLASQFKARSRFSSNWSDT